MSFSSDNEFFLRDFRSKCRLLTGKDLSAKYAQDYQKESRLRMARAYGALDGSLNRKAELYEELLEHFGILDLEFLAWNIYYDEHATPLFLSLSNKITQLCGGHSTGIFLDLLIGRFSVHNDDLIKGFLKSYFIKLLSLKADEWENETLTRNPVIESIAKWLTACLVTEGAEQEVLQMILHFTKLWSIYYARPYNCHKGLIFYHKFFDGYDKILMSDLRTNISECIEKAVGTLDALFVPITHSPFTDIDNRSFHAQMEGRALTSVEGKYIVRTGEFHERMKSATVYFKNLESIPWLDLVEATMDSTGQTKEAYMIELDRRSRTGQAPTANEIIGLGEYLSKDRKWSPTNLILAKVIQQNYIFFV